PLETGSHVPNVLMTDIEQYRRLEQLSPNDAISTGSLTNLAVAHFDLKKYEEAIDHGIRATERPNPRIWALCFLAASLNKVGRREEAKKALDRLYALQPKFSLEFVRLAGAHWAPRLMERRIELLRDAGVPEVAAEQA
ncbi:MAG: tetratricopeptide repeat protein, partial [Alphaproteobacteria bacterium]